MRCVVQRVSSAKVRVDNEIVGAIDRGFLVLIGVAQEDGDEDWRYIAKKVEKLRVFEDDNGHMNLSLSEVDGEILAVSQFTLLGDGRKGNRPSFSGAAPPDMAKQLYDKIVDYWGKIGINVETGVFGADMDVMLVNDGPVTILLDSRKII